MTGFRVLNTNHTSFTVSDLDLTIRYFCDCLGFTLTSRAPREIAIIEKIVGVIGADIEVAYLRGPGHIVELIQYLAPGVSKWAVLAPCDPGFSHLAFDVQGIDAAITASYRYGFEPVSDPVTTSAGGPNAGFRVAYLRNGDGLTIEMIDRGQS